MAVCSPNLCVPTTTRAPPCGPWDPTWMIIAVVLGVLLLLLILGAIIALLCRYGMCAAGGGSGCCAGGCCQPHQPYRRRCDRVIEPDCGCSGGCHTRAAAPRYSGRARSIDALPVSRAGGEFDEVIVVDDDPKPVAHLSVAGRPHMSPGCDPCVMAGYHSAACDIGASSGTIVPAIYPSIHDLR